VRKRGREELLVRDSASRIIAMWLYWSLVCVAFVLVIEAGKAVDMVAFVHDCAFVPIFCSTLYIARGAF